MYMYGQGSEHSVRREVEKNSKSLSSEKIAQEQHPASRSRPRGLRSAGSDVIGNDLGIPLFLVPQEAHGGGRSAFGESAPADLRATVRCSTESNDGVPYRSNDRRLRRGGAYDNSYRRDLGSNAESSEETEPAVSTSMVHADGNEQGGEAGQNEAEHAGGRHSAEKPPEVAASMSEEGEDEEVGPSIGSSSKTDAPPGRAQVFEVSGHGGIATDSGGSDSGSAGVSDDDIGKVMKEGATDGSGEQGSSSAVFLYEREGDEGVVDFSVFPSAAPVGLQAELIVATANTTVEAEIAKVGDWSGDVYDPSSLGEESQGDPSSFTEEGSAGTGQPSSQTATPAGSDGIISARASGESGEDVDGSDGSSSAEAQESDEQAEGEGGANALTGSSTGGQGWEWEEADGAGGGSTSTGGSPATNATPTQVPVTSPTNVTMATSNNTAGAEVLQVEDEVIDREDVESESGQSAGWDWGVDPASARNDSTEMAHLVNATATPVEAHTTSSGHGDADAGGQGWGWEEAEGAGGGGDSAGGSPATIAMPTEVPVNAPTNVTIATSNNTAGAEVLQVEDEVIDGADVESESGESAGWDWGVDPASARNDSTEVTQLVNATATPVEAHTTSSGHGDADAGGQGWEWEEADGAGGGSTNTGAVGDSASTPVSTEVPVNPQTNMTLATSDIAAGVEVLQVEDGEMEGEGSKSAGGESAGWDWAGDASSLQSETGGTQLPLDGTLAPEKGRDTSTEHDDAEQSGKRVADNGWSWEGTDEAGKEGSGSASAEATPTELPESSQGGGGEAGSEGSSWPTDVAAEKPDDTPTPASSSHGSEVEQQASSTTIAADSGGASTSSSVEEQPKEWGSSQQRDVEVPGGGGYGAGAAPTATPATVAWEPSEGASLREAEEVAKADEQGDVDGGAQEGQAAGGESGGGKSEGEPDDRCGQYASCESCRDAFSSDASIKCTWKVQPDRCVTWNASGNGSDVCPAAGVPANATPEYREIEPPALWKAAGIPFLVILLCGGFLVFAARIVRKCMIRGGAAGADYTLVDTANANDASGGGDNWGWDGEDDAGEDIEMQAVSASAKLLAEATVARESKPSSPGSAVSRGALGRQQSEVGAKSSLSTSGGDFNSRMPPLRPGLTLSGAGGAGPQRQMVPAAGTRGASAGERTEGRSRRDGASRKGNQKQAESAIILPDDDLFAELGIEAKPTFRGKRPSATRGASQSSENSRSLALDASADTGGNAAWLDDDLDDLLK